MNVHGSSGPVVAMAMYPYPWPPSVACPLPAHLWFPHFIDVGLSNPHRASLYLPQLTSMLTTSVALPAIPRDTVSWHTQLCRGMLDSC